MKKQVYLINLDTSTERLTQADVQLKKYDIDYEKISAVDGRKLDVFKYPNYDSAQAWISMGRDLLGAEIGCYLSHVKCIEAFLASDADYGIVLEDDLQIDSDFLIVIDQAIELLNKENLDWYLINIGSNKKKISRCIKKIEGHSLLKAYYFPVLTLGLVWSRIGAQEFLSSQKKICSPIDVTLQSWLTSNAKGLSFYPALIHPTGVESDIDTPSKANSHTINARRRVGKRYPRQKRMWLNKWAAIKNMFLN